MVCLLALVAAFCSSIVFAWRGWTAWSVAAITPGAAITSGFETESLFALYRRAHHEPVYLDTTKMPYASAYFNWLFYAAYAEPMKPIIRQYGDATIPRVSRVLSAVGGVVGVFLLVLLGRWLLPDLWPVTISVATWVFFGPLVGWWAHTARPDVWALTSEAAAMIVLLRFFRARPTLAALAALGLFYAAWAFKPTYVFGLSAAIAFLFVRRRFGAAAILAFGSIALWVITFWALGPAYQAAMHSTAVTNNFYLSVGWNNLYDTLKKTAPLILLSVGLLYQPARKWVSALSTAADDTILLGKFGVIISTPMIFFASCKLGAASNYFFTPLLMLAILVLGLATRKPAELWFVFFLGLVSVMQVLVLSGKVGQLDLRPQADELAARWSVWKDQPEPRFSADSRLDLPWLSSHSPPLVLAFNYDLDRAAGRKFEAGGVGGLISSGFFAALMLPEGELNSYDGGDLRLYQKARTVAGMSVYLRSAP